jgi:ADP-ribose pyrophosphatase YjhB (NUDIX family)
VSIAERTRREVRRRLERLREAYGAFPVREATVENDPDRFEAGVERAERGWVGDAGAFVTDDAGRALFVRHADAPELWGTPGGGHEPGETLAGTARREVREETGVRCDLAGVALARHKTAVHRDDPDRRLHLLTVEFQADYRGGGVEVGDDEVIEARWFSAPPPRVDPFVASVVTAWSDGA